MIWRVRVLLFYIAVFLLTVLHILPLLFFQLLRVKYSTKYLLAITYNYSFVYLVKLICDLSYKVEGLENIPKKGPFVIMANHQSFWDNVIMPVLFPMQSWIIKKQLLDIPVFGLGLKLMDPIALDRTNAMSVRKILQDGAKKLKNGLCVMIFPESTRLRPDQTIPFKPAGATLAYQNNVPIVPMAHNAGLFWPKGFWIRPGVITVRIGKPIVPNHERTSRELNKEVEDWVVENKNLLCSQKQTSI